MKTKSITILIVATLLLMLNESEAEAEVLGPLLMQSTMELGVQATYVDRIMGPESSVMTFAGTDLTLVGRYGLTRNATISWELYTGDNGVYLDSGYDLRYYTIGVGAQLLIWDGWGMKITAGAHYKETLIFGEAGLTCQKAHRNISNVILVEKSFDIFGQEAIIWGGPGAYSYRISSQKGANSFYCSGWTRDSLNIWGFSMGMNLILWDHLVIYSFFNYVDKFEPRVGLMYRF